MKNVVVAGFEPFGGDTRNPSAAIATTLDGRTIGGRRVIGAVLPCRFGASAKMLGDVIDAHKPELVVAIGLAGGRTEITPERVAINVDDARIADNGGRQPVDRAIAAKGPVAYWSTLPIKAIVAAMKQREIPASVSQTAGTFVCNHVFYALMHRLRKARTVRGGFIHVPWPADWPAAQRSAIPFATMVDAIELAVAVSLKRRRDLSVRGGAEH